MPGPPCSSPAQAFLPQASSNALSKGDFVNWRYFDWIWHIRGTLPLGPDQTDDDVFGKLDPLFEQHGTSHERTNDTLTFRKKNQAAQDKMSIFDGGVLQLEKAPAGPVLHYHLTSRALLFCFLAPLLFLAFAQITIVLNKLDSPTKAESDKKSDKAKEAAKKDTALPQHPIDKFLGAPAPEKPKKDKDKKKGANGGDGDDKKPTPTPAYVFAALFATLYVVGRVLEARLVKSLFKKRLRS
jgi:hypothetical protein